MISKALKPWRKLKEPTTGFGKIKEKILSFVKEHFYYPVESFLRRNYERTKRSVAYARFGWLHYDFDSAFLYDLMAFKLRRILDCLIHGHAIQEKENMDALREAIKICDRLHENEYDAKYYKAHEKKWGKLKTWFTPVEGSTSSQWNSTRKGIVTKADERNERKDHRKIWDLEEQDRRADIDRLAEILKKYERSWWD